MNLDELPSYRVSLPVFEGPLDLLLYLVRKQEVDIYDIEISTITDQYLQAIEQMQDLDLDVAGDFLVMAANLIYIKSRTLLPVPEQLPEDEADEDDPRWELIRQLVEYKKFKEAAGNLQEREESQYNIYHRVDLPQIVSEENPGIGKVGMLDLVKAIQRVLDRLEERQAREGAREIYEEVFTVSQKMELILERVQVGSPIQFTVLFGELASRNEIVVTFLALLELIRLKQMGVTQSGNFADIEIYRVQTDGISADC